MPAIQNLIPDDTITGMARRAYTEYGRQHKNLGMTFPPWDSLTIQVKANWKLIVARALGQKTDVINVNRMERKPFVVILTGFTELGAQQFRKGIEDRLAAQSANMERITRDAQADGDDGAPVADGEPGPGEGA